VLIGVKLEIRLQPLEVMGITDAISNAGGTPSVQSGLDASKPAAGTAGQVYIAPSGTGKVILKW
jgi:hypothetical protein